jgi:hypothetical protein
MAGRRQAAVLARGLEPGVAQAVANDAMGLGLAEIRQGARQGFGEVEQRIGARPERTQRQPCRRLAAQARNDAGLEQRRLAGAGCAQNHQGPPVGHRSHLPQRFQRLGDLAAAAKEQRGVGVVVAERGEAGERHRTQLVVDREGFGVEADATDGAGRAQSDLQAAGDAGVGFEVENPIRLETRNEVEALILGADFRKPLLGFLTEVWRRREQKQRNDALAHVPGGAELVEAFIGGQPVPGDEAGDDAASPGGLAQFLAPLVAAGKAVMIDENVGEAVGAQPRLQRGRRRVVLAGMAYEQDRHVSPTPPDAPGPMSTGSSKTGAAANRRPVRHGIAGILTAHENWCHAIPRDNRHNSYTRDNVLAHV